MKDLVLSHSTHIWSTNELYDFFSLRLKEMGELAWSVEDIQAYDEWHHPHVLFAKLSDHTRFFRVVHNGTGDIIGYFESKQSGIDPCTQIVQWIMVREDYRGRGIAKRLYRAFESWCQENDYTIAKSCATVQNETSRRMHKAFGFEPWECEDGIVWFHKELD